MDVEKTIQISPWKSIERGMIFRQKINIDFPIFYRIISQTEEIVSGAQAEKQLQARKVSQYHLEEQTL